MRAFFGSKFNGGALCRGDSDALAGFVSGESHRVGARHYADGLAAGEAFRDDHALSIDDFEAWPHRLCHRVVQCRRALCVEVRAAATAKLAFRTYTQGQGQSANLLAVNSTPPVV